VPQERGRLFIRLCLLRRRVDKRPGQPISDHTKDKDLLQPHQRSWLLPASPHCTRCKHDSQKSTFTSHVRRPQPLLHPPTFGDEKPVENRDLACRPKLGLKPLIGGHLQKKRTWSALEKGNSGSGRHARIPDPGSPGVDNTCIRANAQRLGACASTSNHWAGQSWGYSGRAASFWMGEGRGAHCVSAACFWQGGLDGARSLLHGGLSFHPPSTCLANPPLPRGRRSDATRERRRNRAALRRRDTRASAQVQPICQTREAGSVGSISYLNPYTWTRKTRDQEPIPCAKEFRTWECRSDEGVVIANPDFSFWVWLYLARQLLVGCGTNPSRSPNQREPRLKPAPTMGRPEGAA
jgi:hypothetical protein